MTTIRIKNTEANKSQLELGMSGATWQVEGRYILVTPSHYHQAWINSGQMSVASYKKNVLGL